MPGVDAPHSGSPQWIPTVDPHSGSPQWEADVQVMKVRNEENISSSLLLQSLQQTFRRLKLYRRSNQTC